MLCYQNCIHVTCIVIKHSMNFSLLEKLDPPVLEFGFCTVMLMVPSMSLQSDVCFEGFIVRFTSEVVAREVGMTCSPLGS